jgi:predicted nuclease of restriction endonuclease-like (RecB) superfamily
MSKSLTIITSDQVVKQIRDIITETRQKIARTVNHTLVKTYWLIGKLIVEQLDGHERAEYGNQLIEKISKELTIEFGSGFSKHNLWRMKQFYEIFPIVATLRRQLSWYHYKILISINDETRRTFYLESAVKENWSSRQLERQVATLFYDRLLATQKEKGDIKGVKNEIKSSR